LREIYSTAKGEKLYSEPGAKGPNDKRLYIGFNGTKWAHTLELIGAALRAKAHVEDTAYGKPYQLGKLMLLLFIADCILTKTPIKELLKKYKIPERG